MGKGEPLDRQITIRASAADVERLDRLAVLLASRTPGLELKRTDAVRAAINRGMEALEAELASVVKKKR